MDNIEKKIAKMSKEDVDSLMKEQNILNEDIKDRIKEKTLKKIKHEKRESKKAKVIVWISVAAMLCIVLIASFGFNTVVMAVGKAFGFIPGEGIVENQEKIFVSTKSEIVNRNDKYKITINSIYTEDDYLYCNLYIDNNKLEDMGNKTKLQTFAHSPDVVLEANGEKCERISSQWGLGSQRMIVQVGFEVGSKKMSTKTEFKLLYNQEIALDFRLKEIDRYDDLDELGTNVSVMDFDIVATEDIKENDIYIILYSVNNDKYEIASYVTDEYNEYQKDDIYLLADGYKYEYEKDERGHFGPLNSFNFKNVENFKNAKLIIPHLKLETNESKNLQLKIPDMNEEIEINKEVKFEDSKIIINSVKTVKRKEQFSEKEYNALKINMEFVNLNDEISLNWVYLDDKDRSSGGFSWEYDNTGSATTYYYAIDDNFDKDIINLEIENPNYIYNNTIEISLK